MVKFEKRVAKNKISRFFKTTPLVIFLHCIDQKDFYEKLTKTLITNKSLQKKLLSNIQDAKVSREGNLNLAEIKNCIALEGLAVKLVKNNYAKKALIENKALMQNLNARLLSTDGSPVLLSFTEGFANTSGDSSARRDTNADAMHFVQGKQQQSFVKSCTPVTGGVGTTFDENKAKKGNKTGDRAKNITSDVVINNPQRKLRIPLFQASYVLLAFKEVNCLAKIKDFIEDKNIDILGAIYEHNNVIDSNQIKTLATISQDNEIYANLITKLKSDILTAKNQLSSTLDFRYLLQQHYKILFLTKYLLSILHSKKS